MDIKNLYHTRVTFNLHRLEYFIALLLCLYLLFLNYQEVNWILFIGLFSYIDIIGYIPGLIAYKMSTDGRVKPIYYVLYNTAHHGVVALLVLLLVYQFYGVNWAFLAVPIHLCGDRGLLGNFFKPFSAFFEAQPSEEYCRFEEHIKQTNVCS